MGIDDQSEGLTQDHVASQLSSDAPAATTTQEATTKWYTAFAFPLEPEPLYRVTQDYRRHSGTCPNTNFLKGVKWSPDGACLLTASDDNWLRLYDLPQDAGSGVRLSDPDLLPASGFACPSSSSAAPAEHASAGAGAEPGPSTSVGDNLFPALRMHAGETVYDYGWYSRMSTLDPVSCCLASTSRGHPIHLWDACTGTLRCSYRGYNDVDEPTAAYSLGFNPDGTRLFGGYNKSIFVFDVSRPGREYKRIVTHKRRHQESLAGIVSCLAFSPGGDVFAAGTYTGALGVYDARTYELLLLLSGNRGGLTQIMFSSDGNYLYTGARQDDQMFCWDVRTTYEAVYVMQRASARTNQRVQFDIEPCGKHLITGGCDGAVTVFDLQSGSQVDRQPVAEDTVNGVSIHPCLGLLATASGHRRYSAADDPDDSDGGKTANEVNGMTGGSAEPARPSNSLVLWRLRQEYLPLPDAAQPLYYNP